MTIINHVNRSFFGTTGTHAYPEPYFDYLEITSYILDHVVCRQESVRGDYALQKSIFY